MIADHPCIEYFECIKKVPGRLKSESFTAARRPAMQSDRTQGLRFFQSGGSKMCHIFWPIRIRLTNSPPNTRQTNGSLGVSFISEQKPEPQAQPPAVLNGIEFVEVLVAS